MQILLRKNLDKRKYALRNFKTNINIFFYFKIRKYVVVNLNRFVFFRDLLIHISDQEFILVGFV